MTKDLCSMENPAPSDRVTSCARQHVGSEKAPTMDGVEVESRPQAYGFFHGLAGLLPGAAR
jgi:hypothetical protein